MLVPQSVWDCFLVRHDNQIGMQELLAVPLALETFKLHVQPAVHSHKSQNVYCVPCGHLGSRWYSSSGLSATGASLLLLLWFFARHVSCASLSFVLLVF